MLTDDNARDLCSSLGTSNQAVVDIKGYKANFLIKKNLTIPDLMNISFSRGKFIVFFHRVIAWQWWISMPGVQGFIYIRAKAMSLLVVHRELSL